MRCKVQRLTEQQCINYCPSYKAEPDESVHSLRDEIPHTLYEYESSSGERRGH